MARIMADCSYGRTRTTAAGGVRSAPAALDGQPMERARQSLALARTPTQPPGDGRVPRPGELRLTCAF